MIRTPGLFSPTALLMLFAFAGPAAADTLEQRLLQESTKELAKQARLSGDSRRGAILFHQVHVGCVKCHSVDGSRNSLGPDLTSPQTGSPKGDEHYVASILKPSEVIRKGYETISVVDVNGLTTTGLLVSRTAEAVIVRDPTKNGERVEIAVNDIDELVPSTVSIMPSGIVNQLANREQFLDLVRYVLDIREGGQETARALQPPPGLIAFSLPEYEKRVDHAGLILALDEDSAERGKEIYDRLCVNCHGTRDRVGSLPTALRFGSGRFRHGGDPYSMYKTLTHGFGLMVPQAWMVPKQKYDVVHYIREEYVRKTNPDEYRLVNAEYLAGLPNGDTFGPEPVKYAPWSDMDYGPSMINTFEVGSDGKNFSYKGIAVRLDPGPGGISRGNQWSIFDHDTMRLAAAWVRPKDSAESGFINWQGIHFDGRHGTHPRTAGDILFSNPTGPGWARPDSESFEDNERVVGRDGRRYGPLPPDWAKYEGLHSVGDETIVQYRVGDMGVLESFDHIQVTAGNDQVDVFSRLLDIRPSDSSNLMLVATHTQENARAELPDQRMAVLRPISDTNSVTASQMDGRSYLQISDVDDLDMTRRDFTIAARIKTVSDGTIFCKTAKDGPWVPNGKTFFVRNGRLGYDIGWVGSVQSRKRVDDGKWHDVAMSWNHESGRVSFFIDGQKRGSGQLRPKAEEKDLVARVGFTASNFPATSQFSGQISNVGFWDSEVPVSELRSLFTTNGRLAQASWDLNRQPTGQNVSGQGESPRAASLITERQAVRSAAIVAGLMGNCEGASLVAKGNRICVSLQPGADRELLVWTAAVDADLSESELELVAARVEDRMETRSLRKQIEIGGSTRWPEEITTLPQTGSDTGAFAVDVLATPSANPWFARVRLTGHDFFEDRDRAAVCSWDGDVWIVRGLSTLQSNSARSQLKWRRIASGLFQPLGLKIVAGDIYLTCRDQLVILRDQNNDGETDFYECFNNDHQVTEHFHEFAMGLQRDQIGNFYYAKSARHALKAVVPHHGTLLRVPSDGSRTEILATGFRAANGVCLNSDGTFIVTDQEGHWNPKNRINWVREGGFYGNMFGYHNVADDSDDAMDQPLCWITNAFDRSPAELLWVNSSDWGPLNGRLLNISYGYGKVYVVPHEDKSGQMQGGMCQLPIPQFPTGTARGRFNPFDGSLYLSGMFAWGSSQQTNEGGFYRIRATGQPSFLPVELNTSPAGIDIVLSDPVDVVAAVDASRYQIKVWSLKRTANYGSKHYDERPLSVASVNVSPDGRTISLAVPDLAPTWCMEIKCQLPTPTGGTVERIIHNTIHRLTAD